MRGVLGSKKRIDCNKDIDIDQDLFRKSQICDYQYKFFSIGNNYYVINAMFYNCRVYEKNIIIFEFIIESCAKSAPIKRVISFWLVNCWHLLQLVATTCYALLFHCFYREILEIRQL